MNGLSLLIVKSFTDVQVLVAQEVRVVVLMFLGVKWGRWDEKENMENQGKIQLNIHASLGRKVNLDLFYSVSMTRMK
jgi:hypothetical protein